MSRGSGRAFPVCPQAEHLLYVAVCGSFLPTFQVLGNSANLSIPVSVSDSGSAPFHPDFGAFPFLPVALQCLHTA